MESFSKLPDRIFAELEAAREPRVPTLAKFVSGSNLVELRPAIPQKEKWMSLFRAVSLDFAALTTPGTSSDSAQFYFAAYRLLEKSGLAEILLDQSTQIL
jgi:hypothetical protein